MGEEGLYLAHFQESTRDYSPFSSVHQSGQSSYSQWDTGKTRLSFILNLSKMFVLYLMFALKIKNLTLILCFLLKQNCLDTLNVSWSSFWNKGRSQSKLETLEEEVECISYYCKYHSAKCMCVYITGNKSFILLYFKFLLKT